jgi:hypothetical protein
MVAINLRAIKEGNFRQFFVFDRVQILCDMRGVLLTIPTLFDGDLLFLRRREACVLSGFRQIGCCTRILLCQHFV